MGDEAGNGEQKETVTITLDGRQVEVRPGELVIAAAERHGVYIPRFCYHPRMRPVAMCRMCLVEISGPKGMQLQPACFLPVQEDQEVVTTSAKVKKAQDAILEFLLVNHPLDCPVCDKGGECPLQDQTLAFGPGETRFVEEKRHWAKPIDLSALVQIDRERCIQCDRCTRFADEVAGDPLIEFLARSGKLEVNTFPDHPFSSYFSGNTVQICPVGALLAKPYRFKARPWDLEQVESTCTLCSVGCRIAVQSSADTLTRYMGIDSEPVNQGWLCDKGRFSYEAVNSDRRLTRPLVRRGEELVQASWTEALDRAAQGLDDARLAYGPESVAVIGGARLANEDAYAWAKLAKAVLGTDSTDAQLGDGLPAELVLGLPRATIADLASARAVLLFAPDVKEELPVLYLRLRSAVVENDVPLVELTPQSTGFTRYAKATLAYRPGEVAAVARALVGATDGSRDAPGGVPPDRIAAARDLLAGGDVVVILGRPSLAESVDTVVQAAVVLHQGFPKARFLPALRRGNVHGALDMGLAPGILPGRVALEEGRRWFEEAWGSVPAGRGLDSTGILRAAADGTIHALVLLGADPLADFPDRDLARRGLEGAGFVMSVDCFATESVRQADVVLPAATFAERPGTTTNLEGRVTRLGQKVTAPGVTWPDWVIASELAFRLGSDLGFASLDDIWDEIGALAPSHAGITRQLLGSREHRDGLVPPLAAPIEGATPALETDTGVGSTRTAPSPIDPMADPGIDAVETHGDPLTAMAPVPSRFGEDAGAGVAGSPGSSTAAPSGERPPLLRFSGQVRQVPSPPLDAYSLRLVSGRKLYDDGVLVQRCESLAPLHVPVRLRVNPADLDRLGITTGGQVRLRAPRRTALVEVVADPGVPRGSASLPFNLPGLKASELIDVTLPVNDVAIETP
jgi:NADH-quinone oxidoreductase subunit G